MALPETVRVKLSSEAAGSISVTPVVAQELPLRELVELMLGVAGKDEARVRELLLRGALVNGASRFRWAGWAADPDDIRGLLATFPDPDPSLPFRVERCVRTVLRGGRQAIEISREAGMSKGLFQRKTFWDALMGIAGTGAEYAGYSYRDRADRYARQFSAEDVARIRGGADAVRFTTLRDQIRLVAFTAAELYATRG